MGVSDWTNITKRTLTTVDGLTDEQMAVMRRSLDESFNQISRDMLGTYRRLEGADPRYIQVELAKLKKANIARQILSPDKADQFEAIMQTLLEEQTANGVKYADLMTAALTNPPELVQQFGNINIEAVAAIAKDGRKRLQNHSEDAATKIIDAVANNLLQGGSMAKLTNTLSGQLGLVKHRAENIARTSTMTAFNQASKKRYEGYGVEYVQFIALVDKRTTPWCRWRHMRIVKITSSMPPFHFQCRTTFVGVDPAWLSEDDLKWMQDEMAAAKKTGLVNMNRAPFDEKKPTFYTPSKFKNNIVPFKPEKVAIAKPADKPVEKEADPEDISLKKVGISLDVPSEKQILAPRVATETGIGNPDYTPIDHINYLANKTLVERNLEVFEGGKLNKQKVQSLIDGGLAPRDSQMEGIKLAKLYQKKLEENRTKYQEAAQNKKTFEENVRRTTVPHPEKWKPMMSKKEADEYFADGGYFGKQSFWHGNRKEVTENMKAIGADPDLNTRGLYGQGVYAGSSKGIALTYGNPHAPQQENSTELLEMRIYAKNPYIADEATVNSLVAELYNVGGVTDAGTPQIREFLKAKGYDALYIKDLGYTIAFDKKQVVIVDDVQLTQDMGTDEQFTKPYRESPSKFQREMKKAKNSENVNWEEAFTTDDFDYF